jgi:hypothetical protein
MKDQATETRVIGDHVGEFVPPLNMPECWGVPWDRQLGAALAWQEARAELQECEDYTQQRSYGATRSSAVEAAHGARAPTMRTVARMTTLLSSLRERLLQLQSEVANVAIAEMGQRQAGNAASASAPSTSPPLRAENIERLSGLTRSWFEIGARAQSEMRTMTGLTGGGALRAERRRREVVIDFPDRRAAA